MRTNTKTKAKKSAIKAVASTNAEAATSAAPAQATPAEPDNHGIAGSYAGTSPSFGRKKSRTRVQIERYNTLPNAFCTARDNAFIADLRKAYGKAEFKRLDLDAGNLRRALERGLIQHVAGDPASGQCTFRLTEKAMPQKA